MLRTGTKLDVLHDVLRRIERELKGEWPSHCVIQYCLILSLFITYTHLGAASGGEPLSSIFTVFCLSLVFGISSINLAGMTSHSHS